MKNIYKITAGKCPGKSESLQIQGRADLVLLEAPLKSLRRGLGKMPWAWQVMLTVAGVGLWYDMFMLVAGAAE